VKRLVSSFVLGAAFLSASAQITMYSGKNSFPLVGGNSTATIFYDKYDALVVERSAKMLSQDICEVTGKALPLNGDGLQVHPATNSWEYAQQWYESVPRNTRINKTTLYIKEPGKHYVHIICQDPGTILQKIVIDFGGQRRSYLGPQSTQVK